jgi:hypothetical protein
LWCAYNYTTSRCHHENVNSESTLVQNNTEFLPWKTQMGSESLPAALYSACFWRNMASLNATRTDRFHAIISWRSQPPGSSTRTILDLHSTRLPPPAPVVTMHCVRRNWGQHLLWHQRLTFLCDPSRIWN